MTTDQLTTLLREHVRATEPTHGLDAMVPVGLGRRRLRARRLRLAGAAAAVVAVTGVTVPLALGGGGGGAPDAAPTVTRPGTAASWASRVRAALEPSAGPLARSSVFEEGTRTVVGLGRRGTSWHFVTVAADRAGDLSDPATYCSERLALGYVSCEVVRGAGGDPVVVQELLVVNTGARQVDGYGHYWDLTFARTPIGSLDDVNPGDRFLRREAVAATRYGTLTVTEQLRAPTPDAAAYDVPVPDLVAVATDPTLAAPH